MCPLTLHKQYAPAPWVALMACADVFRAIIAGSIRHGIGNTLCTAESAPLSFLESVMPKPPSPKPQLEATQAFLPQNLGKLVPQPRSHARPGSTTCENGSARTIRGSLVNFVEFGSIHSNWLQRGPFTGLSVQERLVRMLFRKSFASHANSIWAPLHII